jgi:hypothetical protein
MNEGIHLSLHLENHIEHMKLKNWIHSLFEPCQTLYHAGYTDVRPTPAITVSSKTMSPDIIAWSKILTLIFEVKSGSPNADDDFDRAKEYLEIPFEVLEQYLELPVNKVETVLLYFESNLREQKSTEALKAKISLQQNIVIWSLDKRVGQIRLFYGSHSDVHLNDLLTARLPVNLIPPQRIFVQPDSPTRLLARELFLRLFQRAYRTRSKKFSLNDALIELEGQIYAFSDNEGVAKIRKAIYTGTREGLCKSIDSNVWELNLVLGNPERYLVQLSKLLSQKDFEEFM